MKTRAFTLVELLTVIAIIGILAAIIIPTVGKVRATSRRAVCVSNLRQLGNAFEINAVDNRNQYPPPLAPNADYSGAWHDILSVQLYGKNFGQLADGQKRGSVFKCPSADESETSVSYGMNCDLAMFAAGANKWTLWSFTKEPVLRQRIPNPAKTCLLAESNTSQSGSGNTFTTKVLPVAYRHSPSLNILYCDGHVETKPFDQIPPTTDTDAGNLFWRSGEG